MSYKELNDQEISDGEPVRSEVLTKVQENFINHEDRIQGIENGETVQYPNAVFELSGRYDLLVSRTDLMRGTTKFNVRIMGVRLIIGKAGSIGTTEIDLKKKSGVGAWVSVLDTLPSVSFTEGDNAVSNNAVINGNERNCLADDLFRIDITSCQTAGEGFVVRVDYERHS
jgi:hypothetical protein